MFLEKELVKMLYSSSVMNILNMNAEFLEFLLKKKYNIQNAAIASSPLTTHSYSPQKKEYN